MKLWIILTSDAWQVLQSDGILRCDPKFCDPDLERPYRWMVDQARARIGEQEGCTALLWGWYQFLDSNHRMPDLRHSCIFSFYPKGTKAVRLEIELEDSKVLLSSFVNWHYVLNCYYLPATEAEDEEFLRALEEAGLDPYTTQPLPSPAFDLRMQQSWERIFDLDWHEPRIASPKNETSIQAVFWELRLNAVISVKEFTTR